MLLAEVDDHPAFGSYWDDAFAKLFASAKPATLDVGRQFLVIQCVECLTGIELGKFKFNIVENKSLDDRNVCFHKTTEGIRVGMVGHACKHDQKVRLPVVWFQITRLNVVVGANACVISAGFCFHCPSRPWDSVGLCLV